MSDSKFENILRQAMEQKQKHHSSIELSDLESHAILPTFTLSKPRGDIIHLPENFKNNDTVSRYYASIGQTNSNNLNVNV